MSGADFGGEFWDEAVLCEDIYKIPTADVVEVRHGKWTDNGPYDKCSVCKTLYKDDLLFIRADCEFGHPRYCPNCGAKMDGKGDGE